VHYYGQLLSAGKRVELTRILTGRQASALNKAHGEGSHYRAGHIYHGFDSREDVINQALATWRRLTPGYNEAEAIGSVGMMAGNKPACMPSATLILIFSTPTTQSLLNPKITPKGGLPCPPFGVFKHPQQLSIHDG